MAEPCCFLYLTVHGTDMGMHAVNCPRLRLVDSETMHRDLRDILRLLGLGDHARPASPHEVMQNEVIPAVQRLVGGEERAAVVAWLRAEAERYERAPCAAVAPAVFRLAARGVEMGEHRQ